MKEDITKNRRRLSNYNIKFMEYKSSFKNLIIVGTVAAVCAVATLFGGSSAPSGINLSANVEIEQAFI
jgi:hypothetical protein